MQNPVLFDIFRLELGANAGQGSLGQVSAEDGLHVGGRARNRRRDHVNIRRVQLRLHLRARLLLYIEGERGFYSLFDK